MIHRERIPLNVKEHSSRKHHSSSESIAHILAFDLARVSNTFRSLMMIYKFIFYNNTFTFASCLLCALEFGQLSPFFLLKRCQCLQMLHKLSIETQSSALTSTVTTRLHRFPICEIGKTTGIVQFASHFMNHK